ncbi:MULTISPECIES: O-methyltransferase [unclassified Brevibacillus]|uniref:Putative O-methyltransferase n=1 Tax=Brevibacillus brevis (strain 47 / JCM 6285 / NBRC 100599) TaxID=358681 RepID=C0ZEC2_BREBN|nr:O-methyltransferase [Brevibacillus brevis]MBH0330396.1 methyltransferase [Brevibacillus brevis]NRR00805.1 O-methyltransferase [Brevibacillus sp. RS1.1]NRS50391.1 O-methyltransferase [Brevibacillus sp. HB2.2]BAH44131.1 putative O-methyltransferase [Brevibacillus brevis NBRC 100599]
MNREQWTAVDHYFTDKLLEADSVLDTVLQENAAAGLPAIDVAPNQGKFLHLLARIQGARSILEIGTLGGYSTIWLARALPADGRLITLEYDPKHAEVAQSNITRAGLDQIVEVKVGLALDSLIQLHKENQGPFDLIFIDADKKGNPDYFQWALKLSRKGTVIITDNVVRSGQVVDETSTDPNIVGVRQFTDLVAEEKRVSGTVVQTVGSKGYDGFAIMLVTEEN